MHISQGRFPPLSLTITHEDAEWFIGHVKVWTLGFWHSRIRPVLHQWILLSRGSVYVKDGMELKAMNYSFVLLKTEKVLKLGKLSDLSKVKIFISENLVLNMVCPRSVSHPLYLVLSHQMEVFADI